MDNVAHYNSGRIEVIEFIEDQKLGYHLGSVVKYVCRAGKKDPSKEVEDLEKAVWYLKREIELLRAKKVGEAPVKPNDMNPVLANRQSGVPPAFTDLIIWGRWGQIELFENGAAAWVYIPDDQDLFEKAVEQKHINTQLPQVMRLS
jgi:hypothetical protein